MSANVGDRVGAILSANDTTVELIGYGVYEGRAIHPELGFPNPCIKLDNGNLAWGCQCWWGPEEKIKEMIGARQVVNVTPTGEVLP